jgi:hypothetical protein
MEEIADQLKPGVQVKVTQQIAARDHAWATEITGTVVSYEQKKSGSWYAHSKDDRIWLDRLTIKKADGEVSVLNLDQYSRVEIVK